MATNSEQRPIPQLKPSVQSIKNPDGYWILRNLEDFTFLQVGERDRDIIYQLGQIPTPDILKAHNITINELRHLLQILVATGMLEGTKPQKSRRGKFTPFHLLFFKIPLFNPDKWLTRHINSLRWIWTSNFALFISIFLTFSLVIGLSQKPELIHQGQILWIHYNSTLILPFIILVLLVVSIHELGHAFTLKNYGGIVPEIGLLLMCLMPAAYTNTTDSYCLSRFQRILVISAGIITQIIIAAIALWLWNITVSGTWLNITSYLLIAAGVFTIALNLNPLAKYDGYHLLVALTGINNLRDRSFKMYWNLLLCKPLQETPRDILILTLYAPLSLAYIWFIFGFLIIKITDFTLTNIPTTAILLLIIWATYYYLPSNK